jgi:hypothetical protein
LLTPVVALAGAALSVYLKVKGQQGSWWIIGPLIALIALCAGVTSYYSFLRPLKDPTTLGYLALKMVAQQIAPFCQEKGVEVRFNVMAIYRPASCFFLIRRFRIRWHFNTGHDGDGTAEFRITKGVAGAARKSGNRLAINMEDPKHKNNNWGFSQRDLDRLQFPKHTMIWCFPVYELDRHNQTTSRIIGMLSLDSLQPGAYDKLVGDEEVRKQLESRMQEYQDVVMEVAAC